MWGEGVRGMLMSYEGRLMGMMLVIYYNEDKLHLIGGIRTRESVKYQGTNEPPNENISFNQDAYKTTPEMGTPPSIWTETEQPRRQHTL